MSARVLVVDDLLPNVKLLEAKLSAEYFDVVTAMNGQDALRICEAGEADIVLLDVMMPGMDGFEVCRRIKTSPTMAHIPVVMVTALDQPSDRLKGLDAGADDFLTKPLDDTALFARVRSLVRLKSMVDELRNRALASRQLGISDPLAAAVSDSGLGAKILLVEDRASSSDRLKGALSHSHAVDLEIDPHHALIRAAEGGYEVVIVSLDLQGVDGLRLCSQLRSLERTRNAAVLMLGESDDRARILRGLELGVQDFLVRPVDRNELLARVRTQVRRKRFADLLRDSVQSSMEMAVTDQLTGLHNRRHLFDMAPRLLELARRNVRPLCVALIDLDHFKLLNDTFGHQAGDTVLQRFANLLLQVLRRSDVVCRYGGEEFVAVMPDIDVEGADAVLCRLQGEYQAQTTTTTTGVRRLPTCSFSAGIAIFPKDGHSLEQMLLRADRALYRAKGLGRARIEKAPGTDFSVLA